MTDQATVENPVETVENVDTPVEWGMWIHARGDSPINAWLASYDPDFAGEDNARVTSPYPTGVVEVTNDPAQAMRFASPTEVLRLWQSVSTRTPTRPDGKPNRPLSAYTIETRRFRDGAPVDAKHPADIDEHDVNRVVKAINDVNTSNGNCMIAALHVLLQGIATADPSVHGALKASVMLCLIEGRTRPMQELLARSAERMRLTPADVEDTAQLLADYDAKRERVRRAAN